MNYIYIYKKQAMLFNSNRCFSQLLCEYRIISKVCQCTCTVQFIDSIPSCRRARQS